MHCAVPCDIFKQNHSAKIPLRDAACTVAATAAAAAVSRYARGIATASSTNRARTPSPCNRLAIPDEIDRRHTAAAAALHKALARLSGSGARPRVGGPVHKEQKSNVSTGYLFKYSLIRGDGWRSRSSEADRQKDGRRRGRRRREEEGEGDEGRRERGRRISPFGWRGEYF